MIRSRHFLVAGLITAVVAAGLVACKPDASPQAEKAEKWLNDFYTHYTIRGGWGFFGAEAKDKNVYIAVNVPNQQALDLKSRDSNEQERIIRMFACPPSKEDIWSILDYEGDVIIQTRSGGNIFSNVPCRNSNPKGSVQ